MRFLPHGAVAVVGVAVVFCASCAPKGTEPIGAASGNMDVVAIENPHAVDLGTIAKGTLITHKFPIRNRTDHAVMIKEIKKF